MNDGGDNVFVYLLIDNALLHDAPAHRTEAGTESRPPWLAPLYADHAVAVSPFLVDVDAAYLSGDIDQVMAYVNACRPALHVSIIETGLALERIAQHLRRFIFVLDPHGKQYTLRYADCAVLAPLSTLLTAAQWATMREPIARWSIHDRAGAVIQLPPVERMETGPTPLCLDNDQLAALDEASEPDHYIAKVRSMRNGAALPGDPAEQHAWAHAARQAWRAAGNANPRMLLFLTEAALLTRGEVLRRLEMQDLLAMDDAGAFRGHLRELVKDIRERRRWVSQGNAIDAASNSDLFF